MQGDGTTMTNKSKKYLNFTFQSTFLWIRSNINPKLRIQTKYKKMFRFTKNP